MHTASIIWIIVMFTFIIKAKKKRKVSIKQANGANKRLIFASSTKQTSTNSNSNKSMREILNESILITQFKNSFKPKNPELKNPHENINMLGFTANNIDQEEIIQTQTITLDDGSLGKNSSEKISEHSHVAFTNETKTTDVELRRSFSLGSNGCSDCNQTASFTQSDMDISNFHFTYDYNNGTGELYMRCGIAIFR